MHDVLVAGLLKTHLEVAVPLRIQEYLQAGGPSDLDYDRVRTVYPPQLGSLGDVLLFGGKRAAAVMGMLTDGLAVMAFCPGGVSVFGLHFEAQVAVAQEGGKHLEEGSVTTR
jgi:hypothetical protein